MAKLEKRGSAERIKESCRRVVHSTAENVNAAEAILRSAPTVTQRGVEKETGLKKHTVGNALKKNLKKKCPATAKAQKLGKNHAAKRTDASQKILDDTASRPLDYTPL